MSGDASKNPRKTPRQARSRATVDAVLDALDRVLSKSTIREFSIGDVVREAHIARASLYDYFPTREALIAAWEERKAQQVALRVGAQIADLIANPIRIELAIVQVVETVMEAYAEQARTFGYGDEWETLSRSTTRVDITERFVSMVADGLLQAPGRAPLGIVENQIAARLVVYTLLYHGRLFATAKLSPAEERMHRREVAKLIYRYLVSDPVNVPHDGPSDVDP